MISIYGFLALLILGAVSLAAWQRREQPAHKDAEICASPACVEAAQALPTARDWCESIENLAGCCTLCLDESLCLVAAGPKGCEIIKDSIGPGGPARPHLVDLTPHDATPQMLELAAAVRRGHASERNIVWYNREAKVSAASLGRWIAICISFARCILCAILISAASLSCARPRTDGVVNPHSALEHKESQVRAELARWLTSEGLRSVRAGRFRQAEDAASIIHFLSGADAAALLDARIR